jgi:hypothetical protein
VNKNPTSCASVCFLGGGGEGEKWEGTYERESTIIHDLSNPNLAEQHVAIGVSDPSCACESVCEEYARHIISD